MNGCLILHPTQLVGRCKRAWRELFYWGCMDSCFLICLGWNDKALHMTVLHNADSQCLVYTHLEVDCKRECFEQNDWKTFDTNYNNENDLVIQMAEDDQDVDDDDGSDEGDSYEVEADFEKEMKLRFETANNDDFEEDDDGDGGESGSDDNEDSEYEVEMAYGLEEMIEEINSDAESCDICHAIEEITEHYEQYMYI